MTDADLADRLLDRAAADEQVAHRLTGDEDAPALRAEIRRLARGRGMRIRTAEIDGVLLVIRTDAAVWEESAAMMRWKLTPPEERPPVPPAARRSTARSAGRG